MNKIKKEYLVLGIIIVVSIVFLVLKKSDNVNYDLPGFSEIKADEITKIEILKQGKQINIIRDGEKWKVGDKGFLADNTKVDKAKKIIVDLEITELISRAENYDRYGLNDSEKFVVKAYNKDGKVLRKFLVGNASATNQHTYIKLDKDKNVYHARESFKDDFKQSIDDFRDKKILKFDKDEITDLTINYDQANLRIKKTVSKVKEEKTENQTQNPAETTKIVWNDSNNIEMKKDVIESVLQKASDLSCSKYLSENEVVELTKESDLIYTVSLKGTTDYQLKFFKKKDKDANEYPVISSQNKYPFFLSAYEADNLMKKEKDLKPEEKKEEKK